MSDFTVTSSPLPSTFCPASFKEGFEEAVQYIQVEFSGTLTTFNFGSTTPTAENRDKPWLRTESSGAPDRWYVYYNGFWIAKHAVAPGAITLYTGTEASIDTFDSGEAGTVTEISGPFWEKVSALDARFPVGKGTLLSGKVLTVGDSGGEEEHALSMLEMPHHRHQFEVRQIATDNPNQPSSFPLYGNDHTGPSILLNTRVEGGDADLTTDAKNEPHNTMPPYSVVLFIKRTNRLFYRQ